VEGLEVGGGELARDPPDVEVHVSRGRGQVDLDADDVEPDEEAADLDAREVREGAVAEHPRDAGLEVGEVFEVDIAGAGQVDDEATVGGEREEGDGGGEDARGQAVEREDLREGGGGGRGRGIACRRRSWGRAGGEEEEEESERQHWWVRREEGMGSGRDTNAKQVKLLVSRPGLISGPGVPARPEPNRAHAFLLSAQSWPSNVTSCVMLVHWA
jgi:hypothetical protein